MQGKRGDSFTTQNPPADKFPIPGEDEESGEAGRTDTAGNGNQKEPRPLPGRESPTDLPKDFRLSNTRTFLEYWRRKVFAAYRSLLWLEFLLYKRRENRMFFFIFSVYQKHQKKSSGLFLLFLQQTNKKTTPNVNKAREYGSDDGEEAGSGFTPLAKTG